MGTQVMIDAKEEVIDWESFKLRFLEKYFRDNAKYAKEVKFLILEQGNMPMNAYATIFASGINCPMIEARWVSAFELLCS